MKILIITPYRHYPGGVEKMNSLLEEVLVGLGHNVEYLTSENKSSQKISKWKTKLLGLPSMTSNTFKENTSNYDLVICNGEFGLGIDANKCINIFHGSFKGIRDSIPGYLNFKEFLSLTWQSFLQKKSSQDKYVVTVSDYCRNVLRSQGILVDKVINNFVDTEEFKPTLSCEDRENYLFIGKYNYKGKGFDILEKLTDEFKLYITCVTDQKPRDSLRWLKSSDCKSLIEIYNKHRILIFPSRFESSGLVALESMACGVPVVMNRVGCAIELEKVIPEFVCSSNSADEYNQKIKKIEKNYSEFSKRAREFVLKYYNKEQYTESWKQVLEEVC